MIKVPDKRDLTSTRYGRAFLEIAARNNWSTEFSPLLSQYTIAPGKIFVPVRDRASWLDNDQLELMGPLIEALEQLDKRGDKAPLVALLKSDRELPPDGRAFLADLIERYELRRPAHRQRAPAYDRTPAESRLAQAKESVQAYRTSGMSVKDALAKAAKEHSIGENTLVNSWSGRRGSSRRKKKRHPPQTP
jgi:hypothetical protein